MRNKIVTKYERGNELMKERKRLGMEEFKILKEGKMKNKCG